MNVKFLTLCNVKQEIKSIIHWHFYENLFYKRQVFMLIFIPARPLYNKTYGAGVLFLRAQLNIIILN